MKQDIPAETAVLGCLLQGGREAFLGIIDVIKDPTCFSINENSVIFSCIRHCYDTLEQDNIDVTSVISAASMIGLSDFVMRPVVQKHLRKLAEHPCDREHIRVFALKLRRIHAINTIKSELALINEELDQFNGEERLATIMGAVESRIFDLPKKFGEDEENIVRISATLKDYIQAQIDDPAQSAGISTGFPYYDQAIGDGMCPGDLHIICASAKNYKTGFVMNAAKHMAHNGVKVLIMDSELMLNQQQSRLLAMETGVPTKDIRNGKFAEDTSKVDKLFEASTILEDKNIDFVSIAGIPFDEHMATVRRWYHKNIRDDDPCIVIYDYLKVPAADGNDVNEYNMLGFMATSLKDFATKYNVPVLGLVQQTREGGKTLRDDQFTVGDSWKIARYCSSLSVFRKKTSEEMAQQGKEQGNQLLRPAIARDGAGGDFGYINYQVDGSCMQIKELGPTVQNKQPENKDEGGKKFADIEF